MMEEYKPNSNKFKSEQNKPAPIERPKLEKVVTGPVKTRKKSELKKFASEFVVDNVSNVVTDVLIPSVKRAISEIVRDGIDVILYGSRGGGRPRRIADQVSFFRDYSKESTRGARNNPTDNRIRSGKSYDDLVFTSRGDAEAVLSRMDEVVEQYGYVRVSDMFDLAQQSCDYTWNDYGWTSIRTAEVCPVRGGGYVIRMPKAMPIDRK